MVRDIKFRAWDNTERRWITGDQPKCDKLFIEQTHDNNPAYEITHWSDRIVMQFTGLKDKNGKEIYEGDIAQSVFGLGKVFWNEITARFSFEFDTDTDGLFEVASGKELNSFEVVGNIYENADLLQRKI